MEEKKDSTKGLGSIGFRGVSACCESAWVSRGESLRVEEVFRSFAHFWEFLKTRSLAFRGSERIRFVKELFCSSCFSFLCVSAHTRGRKVPSQGPC